MRMGLSIRKTSLILFIVLLAVTKRTSSFVVRVPSSPLVGNGPLMISKATWKRNNNILCVDNNHKGDFHDKNRGVGTGRSRVVVSAGGGKNEVRDDPDGILAASIGVGIATAGLGFAYGQCLRLAQKTVWKTLPKVFTSSSIGIHPLYYITGMFTLGGFLVGVLSSWFQKVEFTVADFVSAFSSSQQAAALPNSRSSLLPLLILSLLTSAFGFSLGPEAPMVCAGSMLGASIAKKLCQNKLYSDQKQNLISTTCAYSGAAGALTAFMGIPIAGSIFALEMTRSSAGMSSMGDNALSPAIAASLAALVVLKGILVPLKPIGGHFDYGLASTAVISGRSMVIAALSSGLAGALIATGFHKGVTSLKHTLWPTTTTTTTTTAVQEKKHPIAFWKTHKRNILIKTFMGLIIGLISSKFPQTMFWGEGSLQCVIDGQVTPFEATSHGLPSILTSMAAVPTSQPFASATAALTVGAVKLLSIALACAAKFPGGIIFPLFAAAAPIAHGLVAATTTAAAAGTTLLPMIVVCLMSATQAAVTRTPLASSLILTLTSAQNTAISTILPPTLLSSYIAVWASQYLSSKSYFQYSETTTTTPPPK